MRIVLYRLLAVLLPLALLEILCRVQIIKPLTLPAPSRIVLGLWMGDRERNVPTPPF